MKRTKIALLIMATALVAACAQTPADTKTEAEAPKTAPLSSILKTDAPTAPMHAFVVPDHRFAAGFEQVTLAELAKDPKAHFQSAAAYDVFKKAFEAHAHYSMTDAEFAKLLGSDRVKTEACGNAEITTAGIDDAGHVGWIKRACLPGEELLSFKIGNAWTVVAAMGCLNPIDEPVMLERLGSPSTGGLVLPTRVQASLEPAAPEPVDPPVVRPNLGTDIGSQPSYDGATNGNYAGTAPRDHNPWN